MLSTERIQWEESALLRVFSDRRENRWSRGELPASQVRAPSRPGEKGQGLGRWTRAKDLDALIQRARNRPVQARSLRVKAIDPLQPHELALRWKGEPHQYCEVSSRTAAGEPQSVEGGAATL